MKYVHQFLLIMTITFIGELLAIILPFSLPASVYGLLLLLICLFTRIIKIEQIEEVANWLIIIMPVLFVPSAVSLMNVQEVLLENVFVIAVIVFISTLIVMMVTGKVAQIMIERKEMKDE